MQTLSIQSNRSNSKAALWTGRVVSGIIVLFLLVDSILKLIMESHYVAGTEQAGFSKAHVQPIGLALLIITILYIIPRTAIIGAVLLTAYLGGAVAVMIQHGQAFLFPVIFCTLAWAGVYFQNAKLRAFLGSRETENKKFQM